MVDRPITYNDWLSISRANRPHREIFKRSFSLFFSPLIETTYVHTETRAIGRFGIFLNHFVGQEKLGARLLDDIFTSLCCVSISAAFLSRWSWGRLVNSADAISAIEKLPSVDIDLCTFRSPHHACVCMLFALASRNLLTDDSCARSLLLQLFALPLFISATCKLAYRNFSFVNKVYYKFSLCKKSILFRWFVSIFANFFKFFHSPSSEKKNNPSIVFLRLSQTEVEKNAFFFFGFLIPRQKNEPKMSRSSEKYRKNEKNRFGALAQVQWLRAYEIPRRRLRRGEIKKTVVTSKILSVVDAHRGRGHGQVRVTDISRACFLYILGTNIIMYHFMHALVSRTTTKNRHSFFLSARNHFLYSAIFYCAVHETKKKEKETIEFSWKLFFFSFFFYIYLKFRCPSWICKNRTRSEPAILFLPRPEVFDSFRRRVCASILSNYEDGITNTI